MRHGMLLTGSQHVREARSHTELHVAVGHGAQDEEHARPHCCRVLPPLLVGLQQAAQGIQLRQHA